MARLDEIRQGDLVWIRVNGETSSDTIGTVKDIVHERPGDEPHVRVQCHSGSSPVLWNLSDVLSAGTPRPYTGNVIIEWLRHRPPDSRKHESWPVTLMASDGNGAVKTTDPFGEEHWLILPNEFGRQVTYEFQHESQRSLGIWPRRIVAQGLDKAP